MDEQIKNGSKKWWVGGVVVIIIIIIAVIVTPSKKIGTINIGIIGPFTGARTEAGNFMKNALMIAEKEINTSNSKKFKINFIYEDSKYEPPVAVSAYQKLKNVNLVNYLIGPMGSSEVLAIAPLAEKDKTLLITPGSQTDKISQAGDYIFRLMHKNSHEIPSFGKLIASQIKDSPLYVISINTDIAEPYSSGLKSILETNGSTLGVMEKVDPKEVDFKTVLLKLKVQNPKYLLMIATTKQEGLIIKQANDLGLNISKYFGLGVEGPEIVDIAGKLAEGLLYPYSYDSSSLEKNIIKFKNKYIETYNKEPDAIAANSYDAAYLISGCLEKVGDNVNLVKQCLYDTRDFEGAGGKFSIDSNGDAIKEIFIKTIKDGQFIKFNIN